MEIRFTHDLINVVIDRFGKEAMIENMRDMDFMLIAEVIDGEGFLTWFLQFGEKAKLQYPDTFKEKMVQKIRDLAKVYGITEISYKMSK